MTTMVTKAEKPPDTHPPRGAVATSPAGCRGVGPEVQEGAVHGVDVPFGDTVDALPAVDPFGVDPLGAPRRSIAVAALWRSLWAEAGTPARVATRRTIRPTATDERGVIGAWALKNTARHDTWGRPSRR